jgi:hypothetical protein
MNDSPMGILIHSMSLKLALYLFIVFCDVDEEHHEKQHILSVFNLQTNFKTFL